MFREDHMGYGYSHGQLYGSGDGSGGASGCIQVKCVYFHGCRQDNCV